jgi:hypothetical protein
MFYDVKILSPQGKIRKIISAEELSSRYWQSFYNTEANRTLNSSGTKQVAKSVRRKMDREYAPFREKPVSA